MWQVLTSLLLCSSCLIAATQPPPCCLKVDTTTKHIIDATGRYRLFHGVNVVYKLPPYHPQLDSFDPEFSLSQEDIDFLVTNGFNVVRLYIAWPGVEPVKDQYNDTYLDVISDIVNKLGQAGILTILDCHQDLLSPKFCGEGVPDYAALYMNRSVKPLPFPEPVPQLSPFKIDNTTGYPYRNECLEHQFFTYYFSDAEGKAWQSLYDNEAGVRDRMEMFWSKVAQQFAGNPYILGYELINEPWAGDIYTHPDQLLAHVADQRNLQPLYKSLHSAMRQFDSEHILLFEPTIIVTDLPLKISSTGLTEGPGGVEFNDRQILSYHMYCILLDKNGQPRNGLLCDSLDHSLFNIRISDQDKLGVAGFMTEWGAYTSVTPGDAAWQEALELLALADENFQSWAYWQYKGYGDITTQSNTGEGLWSKTGVNHDKLKLMSRTYTQAVAGLPLNQTFDPKTSAYTISYKLNKSISSPTEIYLNEQLYYPNGYTVTVQPSNVVTVSNNTNMVYIMLTDAAMDDQVLTVEIMKK